MLYSRFLGMYIVLERIPNERTFSRRVYILGTCVVLLSFFFDHESVRISVESSSVALCFPFFFLRNRHVCLRGIKDVFILFLATLRKNFWHGATNAGDKRFARILSNLMTEWIL